MSRYWKRGSPQWDLLEIVGGTTRCWPGCHGLRSLHRGVLV